MCVPVVGDLPGGSPLRRQKQGGESLLSHFRQVCADPEERCNVCGTCRELLIVKLSVVGSLGIWY